MTACQIGMIGIGRSIMNWELFSRLFTIGIPNQVIVGVFLIRAIASMTITYINRKRFTSVGECAMANRNNIVAIWGCGCMFLMLWITILSRLGNTSTEYTYELMPLWSLAAIKDGYFELITTT